jgi:hypothetical protein
MRTIVQEFDHLSLLKLRVICGSKIRFFSGEPSPGLPGIVSDYNRILIATETTTVAVELHEWLSNLRDDEDDLGQLVVVDGEPFLSSVAAQGNFSLKFSGQEIEQLFVLRETISHSVFDEADWILKSDIGIAIQTSAGAALVYKAGYQSYLIELAFAPTLNELKTVDRTQQWNFSLEIGEDYAFESEFIPMDDLLRNAKG